MHTRIKKDNNNTQSNDYKENNNNNNNVDSAYTSKKDVNVSNTALPIVVQMQVN